MNDRDLTDFYTKLGDILRDPEKRTENETIQQINRMLGILADKVEANDDNYNVINAMLRCMVNFVADTDSNRLIILKSETLLLIFRLFVSIEQYQRNRKTVVLILYLLDNLTIDNSFGIEKIVSVRFQDKSFFTAILDAERQLALEDNLDTIDELCEDLMDRAAQFPDTVNLSDLVVLECDSFLKQIALLTAGNAIRFDVSPENLFLSLLNGKDSLSKFTIMGNLSSNAKCSHDTSAIFIDWIGKSVTDKPLILSAAFISLGNCITSKESRCMILNRLYKKIGPKYVNFLLNDLVRITQTAEFKYVCYQGVFLFTKLLPEPEFASQFEKDDNLSLFSCIIKQCVCDPVFLNYYTDIAKIVIKCILQFVDGLSNTRFVTASAEHWNFIRSLQSINEPMAIQVELNIVVLRFATKMVQCQDTDKLSELWNDLSLITTEGVSYDYLCERVKTIGVILSCNQPERMLSMVNTKLFQEEFLLITDSLHDEREMGLLKNNVKFVAARIVAISNEHAMFDTSFVNRCEELLK